MYYCWKEIEYETVLGSFTALKLSRLIPKRPNNEFRISLQQCTKCIETWRESKCKAAEFFLHDLNVDVKPKHLLQITVC